MDAAITTLGACQVLDLHLDCGEGVFVRQQAMAWMDDDGLDLLPSCPAGPVPAGRWRRLRSGAMRLIGGGGTVLLNRFIACRDGVALTLTPAPTEDGLPGNHDAIVRIDLMPGRMMLAVQESFLAAAGSAVVRNRPVGSRRVLAGIPFYALALGAAGPQPAAVFLRSRGGVLQMHLADGERKRVDAGHLLAWLPEVETEVDFAVGEDGGLAARCYRAVVSGEYITHVLAGPGILYVQPRQSPYALPQGVSRWGPRLLMPLRATARQIFRLIGRSF